MTPHRSDTANFLQTMQSLAPAPASRSLAGGKTGTPIFILGRLGHSQFRCSRHAAEKFPDTGSEGWDAHSNGFATRKKFRGATDAVYLAPDQLMSLQRCTMSFCWRPIEQYQAMTVQDGSPTRVQRFDAQGRVWMQAQRQQDAVWTHVMMEYSAKGTLNWQTEPFRGGDAIVSTTFWYDDILGRMTKKQVPKQRKTGTPREDWDTHNSEDEN